MGRDVERVNLQAGKYVLDTQVWDPFPINAQIHLQWGEVLKVLFVIFWLFS